MLRLGGDAVNPDSNRWPHSVQDVWAFVREHFEDEEAARLDTTLKQIGDRVIKERPVPEREDDRLVYQAWSLASEEDRYRLAHLFMRTVGHQEFLD